MTESDFPGKKNNQKTKNKNRIFWILQNHWFVDFFWFKGCTILAFSWFCKNCMSGKNVILKLYAKKLLTNHFKCLLTGRWLCAFELQIRIIKGNWCVIKCSLYCKLFCSIKCMKKLPMEKMCNDKEVLKLKVIEI